MSRVVDALLEAAYQDTQLLIGNDEKGDQFHIPRDTDFHFWAPNEEKGRLIESFINDNRYGEATYQQIDGRHSVNVIINMPVTQNVLCAVSGLMVCIAELFEVEYDGWGCVLQNSS